MLLLFQVTTRTKELVPCVRAVGRNCWLVNRPCWSFSCSDSLFINFDIIFEVENNFSHFLQASSKLLTMFYCQLIKKSVASTSYLVERSSTPFQLDSISPFSVHCSSCSDASATAGEARHITSQLNERHHRSIQNG